MYLETQCVVYRLAMENVENGKLQIFSKKKMRHLGRIIKGGGN